MPHEATVDDTVWRYTDEPQLPGREPRDTIVLVHGLGSDATTWRALAPLLVAHYRVIAVEVPGYSLAMTTTEVRDHHDLGAALNAFLRHLGVESYVLVGHSFGGSICLAAADLDPVHCAALVLIAPGGFGPELNPFVSLMGTRAGSALLRALYAPRISKRIQAIAERPRPGDSRIRDVSLTQLVETYERLRSREARDQLRRSVRRGLRANNDLNRRAIAALHLAMPVLIIWGTDDRVLPPWHADRAVAALPSTLHLVPGAGHTPHASHAAEVAEAIISWPAT